MPDTASFPHDSLAHRQEYGLQANYPLRAHNTFGFGVNARLAATISSVDDLRAALADPLAAGLPVLVIGGGSNLVLTGDVDALVLLMAIRGRRVLQDDANADGDAVLIEAGAGENWHDFVTWTLEQGCPGLENLALIPGTVGAAPVQNIGAYGLELADRFASLNAFDRETGLIRTFDAAACAFAYRDSVFKREGRDRFIITSVTFRLPRPWKAVAAYADVARAMSARGLTEPTASDIYAAVLDARRSKLPDPTVIGNAGSFFKNPVVDAGHYHALQAVEPGIVGYPQPDGGVKLAAGWMIDQCGWKGRALGAAAVHERQALVLVNPGQATGHDILALADAITHDVKQRFGVALEKEPIVV
jgi:UDP-N-acetylmuramate dehydrogenase